MKARVLAVLARSDGPLLYSELTRVLVTNRKPERMRSHQARHELREALAELAAEGRVVLRQANPSGRGRVGVRVEVVEPTHEERKP